MATSRLIDHRLSASAGQVAGGIGRVAFVAETGAAGLLVLAAEGVARFVETSVVRRGGIERGTLERIGVAYNEILTTLRNNNYLLNVWFLSYRKRFHRTARAC